MTQTPVGGFRCGDRLLLCRVGSGGRHDMPWPAAGRPESHSRPHTQALKSPPASEDEVRRQVDLLQSKLEIAILKNRLASLEREMAELQTARTGAGSRIDELYEQLRATGMVPEADEDIAAIMDGAPEYSAEQLREMYEEL